MNNIQKIIFRDIEYSYYTKYRTIYFIDEYMNVFKELDFGAYQSVKDVLEYDFKINSLTPTFGNLVYENCLHKSYWESDIGEMFENKIIGFPVQRRGNMKDCFYNTHDLVLTDILKNIEYCKEGKIFNISFKKKKNPYIFHSFQVDSKFQTIEALCFVKVGYDINEYFISDEDEDYDEDYYGGDDVIFVVDISDVESALDALFDCNKHEVKGYKNKTIKIN